MKPDLNHPMGAARIVRREKYAWPGGYPLALVLTDGALLCPACVAAEFSQVSYAHRHRINDGWRPAGLAVLYDAQDDGASETCAHCYEPFFPEEN
jgi:hypothetical protein